jgi:hypothetical protein
MMMMHSPYSWTALKTRLAKCCLTQQDNAIVHIAAVTATCTARVPRPEGVQRSSGPAVLTYLGLGLLSPPRLGEGLRCTKLAVAVKPDICGVNRFQYQISLISLREYCRWKGSLRRGAGGAICAQPKRGMRHSPTVTPYCVSINKRHCPHQEECCSQSRQRQPLDVYVQATHDPHHAQ